MYIYQKPIAKAKKKENQFFRHFDNSKLFQPYHFEFFEFLIQTIFFRFRTTYIMTKFNKKKIDFFKIFRCKTALIRK